jgi:hypothetical protein
LDGVQSVLRVVNTHNIKSVLRGSHTEVSISHLTTTVRGSSRDDGEGEGLHQQDHQHHRHEQEPEDQKERQDHSKSDYPATSTTISHKEESKEEENGTEEIPNNFILLFDSILPDGEMNVIRHVWNIL